MRKKCEHFGRRRDDRQSASQMDDYKIRLFWSPRSPIFCTFFLFSRVVVGAMRREKVGMAGIMIEDQIAPKRCGHTKGKSVVGREEAYSRVRAACDAR